MKPAGLILAGGLSRRMGGGDKALLPLAGKPMLAHVLGALKAHAHPLAINANGDPGRFSGFGLPVIPDTIDGHAGPLAGILAGLEWCAGLQSAPSHLVTAPADTPFLPDDLVGRLVAAAEPGLPSVASSAGRVHPVTALWPLAIRDNLADFLSVPDNRSVMAFLRQQGFTMADIPQTDDQGDPLANVNTPDDHARAEQRMAKGS